MNRRALIVGINAYGDAPLNGCVSDAKEMSACLALDQYQFDCVELLDHQATRSAILEALGTATYEHAPSEFLLIYFAGHGEVLGQHGYLVPIDGAQYDPGISLAQIGQIMEDASQTYQHVLLILDSCYSGSALNWVNSRPLQTRDLEREIRSQNESRCILAACRPEEEAADLEDHGYYTKALLSGLLGDAVDFNGNVTVFALHDHVSNALSPEYQTPVFKGDAAGTVVLGSNFIPRAGKPVPVDELASVLAKGESMVEDYYHIEQMETSTWGHRQAEGAATCSRKLEPILDWFRETETAQPDITRNERWRRARARLREFQGKLATIHPGQVLPWGRATEHLGHGGYGHVWRIERPDGSASAFKVFHGTELDDAIKAQRFSNGYANMRKLDHPRIVKVSELTSTPFGFLMESIPGPNLRKSYIDRRDAESCLRLVQDIAETVRHAHGRGVRHRDIKPENVIIVQSDEGVPIPYLTDFDLAYHETNRTVTTNLGVGGVINYAAPEQFYSPNTAAARAETVDIYALAQLTYFIITGKDPAPDASQKNAQSLRSQLNDWVDGRAGEVLLDLYVRCTDRDASKRPQTVVEFSTGVARAESFVLAASNSDVLSEEAFLARVGHLYAGIGNFSATGSSLSMLNLSGAVQIIIRCTGYSSKKGDAIDIEIDLAVTGDIPVGNLVTGNAGRQAVNSRLDKALARYPDASRHPGNSGAFQTFIEIRGVALATAGVSAVVEILHVGISAIESW